MSHLIYRVESVRFASDAKKGIGGYIAGGRWNTAGHHAVYCAAHLSLAIVEVLAHLTPASRGVKRVYFGITLDELSVEVVPRGVIPAEFSGETDVADTQAIGNEWLRSGRSVALKVPSAIVPGEFNFILNPLHPNYSAAAEWGPPCQLELDRRIVAGSNVRKRTRKLAEAPTSRP